MSYSLAHCEKTRLPAKFYQPAIELISKSMYNSLGRLCDEVSRRNNFFEGNPLTDRYVQQIRLTHVTALLGLYSMWCQDLNELDELRDGTIRKLILGRKVAIDLWGEAVAPQYLSIYFYLYFNDATWPTQGLLFSLINQIATRSNPRNDKGLPSPYYSVEEVLESLLDRKENRIKERHTGCSYVAESFFQLLVACNFKQAAKVLWPSVSRLLLCEFIPERRWQFFQWRSKEGLTAQKQKRLTQEWPALVREASENKGASLPPSIRRYPFLFWSLILVFPHRMTPDGVRWLERQLQERNG